MSGPRFSVVLPTFDRRAALQRTLAAYARQVPATPAFEVVVVDDGSSDGSPEMLTAWPAGRFPLKVEQQVHRGPAAARNRALAVASGELVLFTGDDIEPAADLLLRHDAAHRASRGGPTAFFGRIDWPAHLTTTATMRHVTGRGAQQFSFHYLADGAEYDYRHFYTSNVSVSRELLAREPGPFCEDFPAAAFEDAELAYRLTKHGLKLRYLAGALAWHWHHYDARTFFARQVRCGEMADLLIAKHPATRRELDLALLPIVRWRSWLVDRLGRGRLRSLAESLPERLDDALALAARLDRGDDAPAEPLLLALFRFGFLAGVARRRFAPPEARRVEAALFARLLAGPVAGARETSAG